MKQKQTARVLSQKEIAPDICDMWIETSLAGEIVPGQFIGVYPKDKSTLLPRPISICEAGAFPAEYLRKTEEMRETEFGCAGEPNVGHTMGKAAIRIVYRIAGAGTREFSRYCPGDTIDILGPLGNGFPTEKGRGKKVFLMGGGIGIPPMLELAKQMECGKKQIVAGYRDAHIFLKEEFEQNGELYISTEDGSVGTKGNVLDAIRENGLDADIIFACGPTPMLRAIKEFAKEKKIACYISLEERMACGIGACLGCVCRTKERDPHTNVHNARICKDGPVFLSTEVEI